MNPFINPTEALYTIQYRAKNGVLIAVLRCGNCNLFFSPKQAPTTMLYGEPQRHCPHCSASLIKKE